MLRSSSSSVAARSFRSRDKVVDRRNRMLEQQQKEKEKEKTSTGSTQNALLDAMSNNSRSTLNSTTFVSVPPSFSNNSTASPTAQFVNGTNSSNVNDSSAMTTTTEEFVLSRVFFALAFFTITLLYIYVKIIRKSHLGDEEEHGVDTERRQGRQNHAEHHQQHQHPKMRLSPGKRLGLYNDAFEMNGHQIVLEPHHVQIEPSRSKFASAPSSRSKQEEEKEEASNHDLENDKITRSSTTRRSSSSSQIQKKRTRKPSLKLSRGSSGMLSSAMSILNYNNDGDDFGDDDDDEPSAYLVLDKIDGQTRASEKKQESQNQQRSQQQAIKKSGICSICLERMGVGETIVYSDHEDCQHVFHKHCLVPAFAYSKGSKNSLLRSSHAAIKCPNPCPNCRRNFCATILDHQVALTYGVEIQTTSSTATTTHSQLESDNDDSQQSSSAADTSSNENSST